VARSLPDRRAAPQPWKSAQNIVLGSPVRSSPRGAYIASRDPSSDGRIENERGELARAAREQPAHP